MQEALCGFMKIENEAIFSALLQFKRKWSPQAHVLELGLKTVVPFWRVVGLADSGALLDEVGLEVL